MACNPKPLRGMEFWLWRLERIEHYESRQSWLGQVLLRTLYRVPSARMFWWQVRRADILEAKYAQGGLNGYRQGAWAMKLKRRKTWKKSP